MDNKRLISTMTRAAAISQILGTVCRSGLLEELAENDSVDASVIASKLKLSPDVLFRLCRLLASSGIFTIDKSNRISHNACSRLLDPAAADSRYWEVLHWTNFPIWKAWGCLDVALRDGKNPFNIANDEEFFAFTRSRSDFSAAYDRYMETGYAGRHETIASLMPFSGMESVVDVGGGTGGLMKSILAHFPNVAGHLFDVPEVIENARFDDKLRCARSSGSFFEKVPEGADAYILSYILHDWADEDAQRIVSVVRRSMHANSRLFCIDRVLEEDSSLNQTQDVLLDIHMLVLHGGQERTRPEFDRLFAKAGLSPAKLVARGPSFCVLETAIAS